MSFVVRGRPIRLLLKDCGVATTVPGSESRRSLPAGGLGADARRDCKRTRATTTTPCDYGSTSARPSHCRQDVKSSQRLGRWVGREKGFLASRRRLHRLYERKVEYFLAFVGIAPMLTDYRRVASPFAAWPGRVSKVDLEFSVLPASGRVGMINPDTRCRVSAV